MGQQELTTVLRGRPGQGGSGLRHEGNSLSTSVQRNSFCMYLSSYLSTCLSMVLKRMSDTWRAILSLHVHTCIMHTHTHPPSYTSCPRSSAPLAVCSRSQTRYSTTTSTQLCRWYVPNPRNGAFSLTGSTCRVVGDLPWESLCCYCLPPPPPPSPSPPPPLSSTPFSLVPPPPSPPFPLPSPLSFSFLFLPGLLPGRSPVLHPHAVSSHERAE